MLIRDNTDFISESGINPDRSEDEQFHSPYEFIAIVEVKYSFQRYETFIGKVFMGKTYQYVDVYDTRALVGRYTRTREQSDDTLPSLFERFIQAVGRYYHNATVTGTDPSTSTLSECINDKYHTLVHLDWL